MKPDLRQSVWSIAVLAAAALGVALISIGLLYKVSVHQQGLRLQGMVREQARIIEAMAAHEMQRSAGDTSLPARQQAGPAGDGAAFEAVMSQLRAAQDKLAGLGQTGELYVARREGDSIVYLLAHRGQSLVHPARMVFGGETGEPMYRALTGRSGAGVLRDYRGIRVLAAYEPVKVFGLGMVAALDLAEVRAPFLKADIIVLAATLVFVVLGGLLLLIVTAPGRRRLHESEELTRGILAASPDSIKVLDLEGRLLFMNEGGRRLLEIDDLSTVLNTSWPDLWQGSDREAALGAIAAAKAGGTGTFDGFRPSKKGTPRWWEVVVTPLVGPDGKTERLLAASRDITERRRAQAEIEQLSRSPEENPSPVLRVLSDGTLAYANPGSEALLETLKCGAGARVPKAWQERIRETLAGGRPCEFEETCGTSVYSLLMAPVTAQAYVNVYGREVTDRKRAERQEKQHLEDTVVLRDTALGFISLAPDADIYRYIAERLAQLAGEAYIVVNSHDATRDEFCVRAIEGVGERAAVAFKLLGRPPVGMTFKLTPGELRDHAGSTLARIEGGLSAPSFARLPKVVAAALESVFRPGEVHAMSFSWQGRILGSANIIMPRGVPLRDPAVVEAFINQAAIALQRKLDADEVDRYRAHLEELVRARTHELELVNKELEAFSYSVSHDLRAPLRAINGFALALEEDCAAQLDPVGCGYLDRVRAASRRMSELIDNLLNLARIARQPLERKPVDLSELARTIAGELREAEPARQVELVIPDGMTAQADPVLAAVLLRNLLDNAWKFTGKHPTARIEVGAIVRDGEPVWYVRDDGAGFDMAHAGSLFAPFQRLHKAAEFTGTGIGLATAQRIVRRHGGRAWIEGAVEKGATFYFTFATATKEV